MTRDGLNTLKDIERQVCKLQKKVGNMRKRIYDFYTMEEDVLDRDAHGHLSDACEVLENVDMTMWYVVKTLQKAHKAEKELMDFYDGLLNDKSDE